jgi:uncharacterized protein (DUF2062 family)
LTEEAREFQELLTSDASAHMVALGFAIGFFFGLSPLFGAKTVLTLLFATLLRGNRTAAILATGIHEITLPILPMLLRYEEALGRRILGERNAPSVVPSLRGPHLVPTWLHFFRGEGIPLLVGGLCVAAVGGVGAYFFLRFLIRRARCRGGSAPSRGEASVRDQA